MPADKRKVVESPMDATLLRRGEGGARKPSILLQGNVEGGGGRE